MRLLVDVVILLRFRPPIFWRQPQPFFSHSEPLYHPNEAQLTVATNQALHAQMTAANTDVVDMAVPLSNSRIGRNVVLYTEGTGICDVAGIVKKYVKSIYGATSPQYAQVSGLEFKPR